MQKIQEHPAKEESATSDDGKHTPRSKPSTSRVYGTHCIFCERQKYRKGSKTREPIVKCTELRCDKRIRESAIQKSDQKIIAIASRDLVAAEAHYHHSCYRFYTKPPETTNDSTSNLSHEDEENCLYNEAERQAYESLFRYIRNDLFMNPRVITMRELTARLTEDIKNTGITTIRESTKKHIRRTIEKEFADSVQFCNDKKGKTLIFPINLTIHELAKENQKLKEELQTFTSMSSEDFSITTKAGHIIRASIKEISESQAWPYTPSLVNWGDFRIPELLRIFLTCVLSGES